MMRICLRTTLLGFALMLSVPVLKAQYDLSALVPFDSAVRTGKLGNGLTYYIRHHKEPAGRATFFMIQNVGALLEEDHQDGLAHFLEHMAFNGTRHYPGKGFLNMLQRHGVAFGRNINASTSYQETLYYLSDVPTAPAGLMDSCLLILHDWSDYVLLKGEEIELERGVISEEWRTRRNASVRLQEQYLPVLLKGSRYPQRDIIGELSIIKNFAHDDLRAFYHDWYRTDLQAVAIVGDFDVDDMEARVRRLFSAIPAVEQPKPRPKFGIPDHAAMYFALATDAEATQSELELLVLRQNRDEQPKTWGDVREGLMNRLCSHMLSQRLQELLQRGIPPFLSASAGISGFLRGYDVFSAQAVARPGEEAQALEKVWTEVQRVLRHGFTETELERARADLLRDWHNRYLERDKIPSIQFCEAYAGHYLEAAAVPGIAAEYAFVQQILPTLTSADLLAHFRSRVTAENRTLIITGPAQGVKHLSEAEASGIIRRVEQSEIPPYEDQAASGSLIPYALPGGKVAASRSLDTLDAVEWTLSNGARVVYRHADYEKDQVQLQAFSHGGLSRVPSGLLPSALLHGQFLSFMGVGTRDAVALRKALAGKRVALEPVLDETREGWTGSCAPSDLETLLQLVYLYFEAPRFDQQAYDALMSRLYPMVRDQARDPQKVISDSVMRIQSAYHPRVPVLDTLLLSSVSLAGLEAVHRDRFRDAGDFTFVLVGNVPEDSVRTLVAYYLGSLADDHRSESWDDQGIRPPRGRTERRIQVPMETPMATVYLSYSAFQQYLPVNQRLSEILGQIVRLRMTEVIREREGGTYGVQVSAGLSQYPVARQSLTITFDCDPSRAAHLKQVVYEQLDSLARFGPLVTDFEKTINNMLRQREQSREHNAFWTNALFSWYLRGYNTAEPRFFEEIVRSVTPEQVRAFADAFLRRADHSDLLFVP